MFLKGILQSKMPFKLRSEGNLPSLRLSFHFLPFTFYSLVYSASITSSSEEELAPSEVAPSAEPSAC